MAFTRTAPTTRTGAAAAANRVRSYRPSGDGRYLAVPSPNMRILDGMPSFTDHTVELGADVVESTGEHTGLELRYNDVFLDGVRVGFVFEFEPPTTGTAPGRSPRRGEGSAIRAHAASVDGQSIRTGLVRDDPFDGYEGRAAAAHAIAQHRISVRVRKTA